MLTVDFWVVMQMVNNILEEYIAMICRAEDWTPNMERVHFSMILVTTHKITWCQNLQDHNCHLHHYKTSNLRYKHYIPKCICSLMPAKLSTDTVCNCCNKLSSQTQLGTQLHSKMLRVIVLFTHVPLYLIH